MLTTKLGPHISKPKYDVDGLPVPSSATTVRLEAYPRNTTDCTGEDWQAACYWENYSVENSNHGGFHMDVVRTDDGGAVTSTTEPFRIVDTRSGVGGSEVPFGVGESRSFAAAGNGRIPSSATAVWANVTVVEPTGDGFLTVYPSGGNAPNVSNVNWRSGDINSNMVLIPLNSGGNSAFLLKCHGRSRRLLI